MRLVALLVLLLSACKPVPEITTVTINQQRYQIPDRYLMSETGESFKAAYALQDKPGEVLVIPHRDFGLASEALVVIHTQQTDIEEELYFARQAWQGEALYTDRVVETIQDSSITRVSAKGLYPELYHYFSQVPNQRSNTVSFDETFMANCYNANKQPICESFIISDSATRIMFDAQYIQDLPVIRALYSDLLKRWATQ